uniref:Uncharacterized protein n=1 Tax=Arundo donax TaxID=35708 RepID=A0A0A8ZYE0_ARUDO
MWTLSPSAPSLPAD